MLEIREKSRERAKKSCEIAEKSFEGGEKKERALIWLVEAYHRQGSYQPAETLLTEALAADPFNENLLCLLMQIFHEQGMTHRAVCAYEEFARALQKAELVPAQETTALYDQVRKAPRVRDLSQRTPHMLFPSHPALS